MAKIKYYYNTDTCQYEPYRTSLLDKIFKVTLFLGVALLFGVFSGVAFKKLFEGRELAAIRQENEELALHFELLKNQIEETNQMLASLQERDDNIYRVILEAEPISESIRAAGIGGVKHYDALLKKSPKAELVKEIAAKLDKVKKQMYIQTKSHDEIVDLVNNKAEMLASIPAIIPVKSNATKMVSGFGYRIDPVYHTRKMHTGMDFSARTGTNIYAAGKGKVIIAGYEKDHSGYGQCVVIDHGFGYQTLYAHMSNIKVKIGQKVNRGDVIGAVGCTGKCTGPHLHYEVIKNGKKVNPINFYFNDLSPKQYEEMLKQASQEGIALD